MLSAALLWPLLILRVPHVHDGLAVGLPLLAVQFGFQIVASMVLFHVYRERGLAALWVTLATPDLLGLSAKARSLGDPSFVTQSNLLIGVLLVLLGIGVWGYLGRGISEKIGTLGLGDADAT